MSNTTTNGIIFPRLESWNSVTETATIAVDVNKKRVLCRIEMSTLQGHFGATDELPMQFVARHRPHIQETARRLIEEDAYEEDGSVMIRLDDL